MKEKLLKLWELINEHNKIAMFLLWFLWLILTVLTSIFSWKIAWIVVWILWLISFIWYFFWKNIKNIFEEIVLKYNENLKNKVEKFWKAKIIIIFFILIWIISVLSVKSFYYSEPKIFKLTEWFNLEFEDKFEWGASKDLWRIDDNQFISYWNNWKTLKSSAYNWRWYPMYFDLIQLEWERILLAKFNLKDWWEIGIQFANNKWPYIDETLEKHYNKCFIRSYKWNFNNIDYRKGSWYSIYKRWMKDWSLFDDYNISSWNYYLLAKISWRKVSCYFQKEWEDNYIEILKNDDVIFENLWWPVLTKFIDDKRSYPEILEFKIYTKTN